MTAARTRHGPWSHLFAEVPYVTESAVSSQTVGDLPVEPSVLCFRDRPKRGLLLDSDQFLRWVVSREFRDIIIEVESIPNQVEFSVECL